MERKQEIGVETTLIKLIIKLFLTLSIGKIKNKKEYLTEAFQAWALNFLKMIQQFVKALKTT